LNQGNGKIHVVTDKDLPITVQDRAPKWGERDNPQDISIGKAEVFVVRCDLNSEKAKEKDPQPYSDQDEEELEPALRGFRNFKKITVPRKPRCRRPSSENHGPVPNKR
jgi:hypothetical protein